MQLTTEDQAFIDRNLELCEPLAAQPVRRSGRARRVVGAVVLTGALAAGASACTPTMVNCHPGTVHCWN